MKKNLLKIYEGFFDDLDKLNKNLNKKDKKMMVLEILIIVFMMNIITY